MAALPEAGSQQAASPGRPEAPAATGIGAPSPGTEPAADFALRLQSEGLPEEALAYLRARGLLSERRLAAVAATQAEFVEIIVQPFFNGFEVAGVSHKSQQDPALARALLVIACQMAHEATRAGAATPAPLVPAAPSGGATPQAAIPARAPSALSPGEWKLQIEQFESKWTPRRVFLQKLLIGAETVLARLLHELHTTRLFTPLGLGEILRVRAYTTSGQVNHLATKQRDAAFSLATGKDGAAELSLRSQSWSPSSQWAIPDGLEAVKWAIVFAGHTDCDEVADNWVERFRCMVRLRGDRLDFVKAVYDASSWRLALDMRSGFSFEAATKAISRDTPWLSAFEGQYRAPAQERGERPERGDRRHQERGDRRQQERGDRKRSRNRRRRTRSPGRSEKHRDRRASPPPSALATGARLSEASWVHANDAAGKNICKNFNRGVCKAKECKRSHRCAICLSAAHGAKEH